LALFIPSIHAFALSGSGIYLADLPDLVVSTIVAMGGIEPPSALMLIAISPWLRVEGTAVGL